MDELELLRWINDGEFAQYGECYGATLDSLIAKGLVQVHDDGAHQSGFIAKGSGKMYCAVSLTDAGKKRLSVLPAIEKEVWRDGPTDEELRDIVYDNFDSEEDTFAALRKAFAVSSKKEERNP